MKRQYSAAEAKAERGSRERLRYFLPPERVRYSPLPPCDSTAALLSAHSEREKTHSLRAEGLRHIENPVHSHRRRI